MFLPERAPWRFVYDDSDYPSLPVVENRRTILWVDWRGSLEMTTCGPTDSMTLTASFSPQQRPASHSPIEVSVSTHAPVAQLTAVELAHQHEVTAMKSTR